MKIIPIQPDRDSCEATAGRHGADEAVHTLLGRPSSASRRTFGRRGVPSRRTFGRRVAPSRRTFGRRALPSRRTFGRRL